MTFKSLSSYNFRTRRLGAKCEEFEITPGGQISNRGRVWHIDADDLNDADWREYHEMRDYLLSRVVDWLEERGQFSGSLVDESHTYELELL